MYPGSQKAASEKNTSKKPASVRKTASIVHHMPPFYSVSSSPPQGSKGTGRTKIPERSVTTRNSTKKRREVASFLSSFFKGCLIIRHE